MKRITITAPELENDYFRNIGFEKEIKRKMNGATEPTGRLFVDLEDDLTEILVKEFNHFDVNYILKEVI